jgi:TldD protein
MKHGKWPVRDIARREFLEKGLKGGLAIAAAPAVLSALSSCGGGETAFTKTELDPSLLQWTIKRALEKGGEFSDVYVEHRIATNIAMEESKIKEATFNIS